MTNNQAYLTFVTSNSEALTPAKKIKDMKDISKLKNGERFMAGGFKATIVKQNDGVGPLVTYRIDGGKQDIVTPIWKKGSNGRKKRWMVNIIAA